MNEKACSKCGVVKPLEEFPIQAKNRDGRRADCRSCNLEYHRQRYAASKDQARERHARYHQENRDAIRASQRRYYEENRARIAERGRQYRTANAEGIAEQKRRYRAENAEAVSERKRKYQKDHREEIAGRKRQHYELTREQQLAQKRQYRLENLEQEREQDRLYVERVRAEVLAHYGEHCACCGSTNRLTVDHVNGDGAQHRLELFGSSRSSNWLGFYRWIIANNFPDDLQTLCRSCNGSKGVGERCRLKHRIRDLP